MKTFITALTILILSALAPISHVHSQISLVGVDGLWIDTDGGQNVNGVGTNQINWGITNGQQSGYVYAPASMVYPVDITLGQNFNIATFTHNNFVIRRGTSVQGATLATNYSFLIDGQEIQISSVYDFLHNETNNTSPGCCDDIVTLVNNNPFSESKIIGEYEYTIEILGFQVDDELFMEIETRENQSNDATLVARVTRVAIPEPSTYLLLSSMLVLVILAKRRVKKHI